MYLQKRLKEKGWVRRLEEDLKIMWQRGSFVAEPA